MSLFSQQRFYHGSIKNLVAAFGEFFTGIRISRLNSTGNKDQLIDIPIEFAPKNKWIERIKEEPSLTNTKVKSTFPRLAFEIVDYSYDPNRAIGPRGHFTLANFPNGRGKVFNPTPYDIAINLYLITKTQEDALQVIEQIVPYFKPMVTINMMVIPQLNISKDVPLVLRNISAEDNYLGTPENLRTIIHTFSFIAQMDMFGPINISDKVIKEANADLSGDMPQTLPDDLSLNDDYRYTAEVNPRTANKQDEWVIDEIQFGEIQ